MDIRDLHNQAMELADLADLEKSRGNKDKANSLYEQSYKVEFKAAMRAYNEKTGEPSISILLRSAASLAISCKKNKEAEKLIELGLSGEPPTEIANELRDLLDQVYLDNIRVAIEKYNKNIEKRGKALVLTDYAELKIKPPVASRMQGRVALL